MSNYKVIDDLFLCYKNGQESPDNSPEKESSRVAGQMLVMTFKPLILAAMSRSGIRDDQFEDAFMDGVVAFMEGLKKFDPGRGAGFNAFIQGYLRQYYRKWQTGRFDRSVKADSTLDMPLPGSEGLTLIDVTPDETVNLEADYIRQEAGREMHERLAKGLSRLKPSYRQVLEDHYYAGKTQTEIAEKEGVSLQAVSKRHNHAIKKIKKVL